MQMHVGTLRTYPNPSLKCKICQAACKSKALNGMGPGTVPGREVRSAGRISRNGGWVAKGKCEDVEEKLGPFHVSQD